MTYKVRQSKLKRALSVYPVILSARLSARVRNPDMERILILNSRESANTTLRKTYIAFASAKISLVIPA